MSDTGYLISEAAKITQVDAHVLRYWEEELELPIARNKMGHRYYTREDIQMFQDIKELKKKGLQLRAIKEIVHQRMEAAGTAEKQKQFPGTAEEKSSFNPKVIPLPLMEAETPEGNEDGGKPEAEKRDNGIADKNKPQGKEGRPSRKKSQGTGENPQSQSEPALACTETEQQLRQRQFQEILERLVKQVIVANHQEGRYKRLDAAIRRHQESRRLVAATEEERKKKRNGKKAKGKNRTVPGGKDS